MDEILRTPNHVPVRPASRSARRSGREQKNTDWSDRLHRFADAAAARSRRLKLQSARVYHRVHSATAGKPKLGPLSFLALSLVIGLASVVGVVYTPAYVDLGLVKEPQVFEQVMDRVEARASNILGYDYTLQNQVGYERVLAEREDLSPISGFETYLFSQVGEVMKSYVLTVDGQALGAVTDRAQIDQMLDEIAAPYVNADTISVTYDKAVGVSLEYTPSESIKDISEMKAALTANTSGQTTYEVQKGDTFMALAFSNGMTMAEPSTPAWTSTSFRSASSSTSRRRSPICPCRPWIPLPTPRRSPAPCGRWRTTPCTRASPRSWTPASPARLWSPPT